MSAPGTAVLDALTRSGPIAALRAEPLAYPILEVAHLIAIATFFGTLLVVDLRLTGAMKVLPLRALAQKLLPWTLGAFALAATSGLLMFATRAADFVSNWAFLVKILLLMAAGTNAAILHSRGALDDASIATRMQAAVSIAIWVCVIALGRWIAYV